MVDWISIGVILPALIWGWRTGGLWEPRCRSWQTRITLWLSSHFSGVGLEFIGLHDPSLKPFHGFQPRHQLEAPRVMDWGFSTSNGKSTNNLGAFRSHRGTSKSSIWRGFSMINHPPTYWVTPVYGNPHLGLNLPPFSCSWTSNFCCFNPRNHHNLPLLLGENHPQKWDIFFWNKFWLAYTSSQVLLVVLVAG